MTNIEAIEALGRKNKQSDFEASLISQFRRKGDLSPRQWHWVHKLASEATAPTVQLDVQGIVSLFKTAASDQNGRPLVRPKLHLQDATGQIVVVSVRRDGDLSVSDGNYPGKWFGRIYTDTGAFSRARDCTDAILTLLQDFAANPLGMALAHGKLTGHCCFCGLQLTDDRSVEKGYGPVCAKNWGLPWGK